jgi:hypothetical protein
MKEGKEKDRGAVIGFWWAGFNVFYTTETKDNKG